MILLLDNRPLGSVPRDGSKWWNTLFVCPTCGNAWGRVVRESAFAWSASHTPCGVHGDAYHIGGSFLNDFAPRPGEAPLDLETAFRECPELARWEFQVHLRWAET